MTMTALDATLDWVSARIRRRVVCAPDPTRDCIHTDVDRLRRVLLPGDVVLVDGCDKISAAIRYLTQSSWSHAALFVGAVPGTETSHGEPHELIESNLGEGCVSCPLSKYSLYPTRICRPVNLDSQDRDRLVQYMLDRIGLRYDVRNVIDLARYLIPHPPVPLRWRRKMIALGSGEPTRAICSTLIASAFQSIGYPILPVVEKVLDGTQTANGYSLDELYHIRHHSLFTPRDFDVSPYFQIVKPTLAEGFDYRRIAWADTDRKV